MTKGQERLHFSRSWATTVSHLYCRRDVQFTCYAPKKTMLMENEHWLKFKRAVDWIWACKSINASNQHNVASRCSAFVLYSVFDEQMSSTQIEYDHSNKSLRNSIVFIHSIGRISKRWFANITLGQSVGCFSYIALWQFVSIESSTNCRIGSFLQVAKVLANTFHSCLKLLEKSIFFSPRFLMQVIIQPATTTRILFITYDIKHIYNV